MHVELKYGVDSRLELDFPPGVLIADDRVSPAAAIADPAAAVAAALAAPLGYPPLAEATVPGDRVAIVLADDLPQPAALLAGAVRSLLAAGVEPAHIAVLQSRTAVEQGAGNPLQQLEPAIAAEVELLIHDPADRESIALLGPSSRGKGVYLHRAICEADVVLPISVPRLQEASDYRGSFASLYPTFSDERTIERFHAVEYLKSAKKRARRRQDTDELGWLLGVRLMVQVIPGAAEQIQHVLAGDVDALANAGQQLAAASWRHHLPRRASLVIASIDGGAAQQNWQSVARALAAANEVVAVDGAIALCTDLTTRPGPALMQLAETDDIETALDEIREAHCSDAVAAWHLAHALRNGTVYLLSQLDDQTVEALGVAPVEHPSQIARLPQRFDSCIVLPGAQHIVATVEGNEDDEDEVEE